MSKEQQSVETGLTTEAIVAAFEKLFSGEKRGVRKFARSGLRYVKLPDDAVLIEQNTKKRSEWADLALSGHSIAWAIRDGQFLARVIDGKVEMLR
ncbi:MAG: hypothetical protein WCD76_20225 [Pyrinomonadaceae bacterium]